MSPQIRVAISGGGVAGALVIHALLQYSHLDVHIFESAPAFKEVGVAFGITRNATAALELSGPSSADCLARAGGVQMKGVRFFMGQGPGRGDLVYEADSELQGKQTTTIVQRANLLHELLASVPEQRMHASKKLQTVDRQRDGSLVLHFADGSKHETDILIGADGIHSTVRKIILGEQDPAASPRNTGWWAIMTLQPYQKAQDSIGTAYIDVEEAREINHLADGVFFLHNILSNGEVAQFSVCHKDDDAVGSDKWQKVVTADEIRKVFIHEDRPEYLNKAIEDLLCDKPEQGAIYFWEHPPARTFVDGPIVLVGDAAHATTPWQGSGGGMCVEDSLIISTLLGKAQNPEEARAALRVFDRVRRPRTQGLIDSSHKTGEILTGKSENGLDSAKVKEALAPRWDFIIDFDNKQHRDESLELLVAELKA